MRLIEITSYSSDWVEKFEEEKANLTRFLPIETSIHHIGSTSVPGLPAKPIIDILLEAKTLQYLDTLVEEFHTLGYEVIGKHHL